MYRLIQKYSLSIIIYDPQEECEGVSAETLPFACITLFSWYFGEFEKWCIAPSQKQ